MRPDRRIEDLEERLDNLSRAHLKHSKIIRPNRFTRYDNDLVSRREMDAGIVSALGTAGAVVPTFENLTPLGSETGTSWALSSTPVSNDAVGVYLNGLLLTGVVAGPSETQYTLSGTTLTTGRSLTAGEALRAIYLAVGQRCLWEVLADGTDTGTSWALTNTPASADDVGVFLNGQLLTKVAAAPTSTQYTISGATITTGRSLALGEVLRAFYVY